MLRPGGVVPAHSPFPVAPDCFIQGRDEPAHQGSKVYGQMCVCDMWQLKRRHNTNTEQLTCSKSLLWEWAVQHRFAGLDERPR